MALRIDLPTAGLLGISGVRTLNITADTTLFQQDIYVASDNNDYNLTLPGAQDLPTDPIRNQGGIILIKNIGTGTLTILPNDAKGNAVSFDGVPLTGAGSTIMTNQPVRLIFHSDAIGWIVT